MPIAFDGKEITVPAYAVTSNATLKVTISDGSQAIIVSDWSLDKVTRPNKGGELQFTATYLSDAIKRVKYTDGMTISIEVFPQSDKDNLILSFKYLAKQTGLWIEWNPIPTIAFERVQ